MQLNKILPVIIACLMSVISLAQSSGTASISGHVDTHEGDLPGVIVLLKGTTMGAQTDINGTYSIHNIPPGHYTLLFTSVGVLNDSLRISLAAGQTLVLNRKMHHDTISHEEIVITAKTDNEVLKEQSYNVNVIDATKYANTSADINQVLNRSTGIRIREEGGLGSSFNFMLNGFSGNQVRFFIDGIPMTNFGSALTLNNIPINLAERIEVYKGVVPVWLGADALGGAVNVVTNTKIRNYVDASYSFGSFNTHRLSLNARVTSAKGFMFSANTYANYSDNNFYITAKVSDPFSGAFGPEQKYRHFHDRYKSGAAVIETGLVDKKYADRLLFGFIISGNDKQIQQGATMQQVVGQAFQTVNTFIPMIKYKKDHFLVKGLNMTAFGSYNFSNTKTVDTSSLNYDWTGATKISLLSSVAKAELNDYKSITEFKDRSALITTGWNYDVSKHHNLAFTYTMSNFNRLQDDKVTPTRLTDAASVIKKQSLGFGYKLTALNNRLSATVFVKQYIMNASLANEAKEMLSNVTKKTGYGIATSYFVIPSVLQMKISYEDAYRMPEDEEMLGNGMRLLANPTLKPEHSQNINLSARLQKALNDRHDVAIEGGLIYRNAEDFIRTKVVGIKAINENMRNVRVTGFEAGIKYGYRKRITFEVNGTYQNIINTDKYDPPGTKIINSLYMMRLPNIPFLFGNAIVDFQFNKVVYNHASLNLNLSCNYMEAFYLYWPTLGDPDYKRDIPTQVTNNIILTYSLHNNRYNISLDCRNIMDVKVYDYFYIQKPGRSFSIKLRYFFKK